MGTNLWQKRIPCSVSVLTVYISNKWENINHSGPSSNHGGTYTGTSRHVLFVCVCLCVLQVCSCPLCCVCFDSIPGFSPLWPQRSALYQVLSSQPASSESDCTICRERERQRCRHNVYFSTAGVFFNMPKDMSEDRPCINSLQLSGGITASVNQQV